MHSIEPYAADDIERKRRRGGGNFPDRLLIKEVKWVAIVSNEGFLIASTLPEVVDEKRFAAMTSAIYCLSENAVREMNKGDFDHLYIKGSQGYLLILQAGPNAILVVSTTQDVRLESILLDCRRTCERIAQLL